MKTTAFKTAIVLFIVALLVVPVAPAAPARAASPPTGGFNVLQLTKDSDVMLFNGEEIRAAQPVTYKEGSAYIPLKGIASVFGYALAYDAKTKESVAKSGSLEMRFKAGSPFIKVNGSVVKGPGPAYVQKGYMMVPLRMWANLTNSRVEVSGKKITITWSVAKPSAEFEIGPEEIRAGQTVVIYTDKASHPAGLAIVDEVWEGRFDVFPEAGLYTVTRRVMDEAGNWSEPYSVTVSVLPPNLPPVADFATDKTVYRIGETVRYLDYSTDDENAIVRRAWTGNEPVFFEPGEKRVELEVEDRHGLVHRVSKTITVTNEVLYTREEYNKLFTEIGGKFEVSPGEALTYEPVEYTFTRDNVRLVRSNSPETLKATGIAYDTIQTGYTRFMIHNQSALPYNVNLYLVATNFNGASVDVTYGAYGIGGPTTSLSTVSKLTTVRYLESVSRGVRGETVRLRPKQSAVLLADQLSAVPIKPNQVFSAYADVYSTGDIRYRIVVVPQGVDPLEALESLPLLERDGVHVRGSFDYTDRSITIEEQLGRTKQRLIFGDGKYDPYLYGIDDGTGWNELNLGNYGVLYRMRLHVAPRTLITLNARGGHYSGAFVVNGRVVEVTKGSILKHQGEVCVLYRTGDYAESVEILFTPANGSNLPITLLFEPLPEHRT
jgi:PKD repeat protein